MRSIRSKQSATVRPRSRAKFPERVLRFRPWYALSVITALMLRLPCGARADSIHDYELVGTISLPAGTAVFDVHPDGRLIALSGADVFVETAVASGSFQGHGALANADIGTGAAFVRVSPDGTKVAVGNGGGMFFNNFEVGVFDFSTLTGTWYEAGHFDAAWVDNTHLALTAGEFGLPAMVTILDTSSPDPANPVNPIVIDNVGGASAGIAFDAAGRLYTGNGFAVQGPSGTGAIKAFSLAAWTFAWTGGPPLNFETNGVLVIDVLSAASLGFDDGGHLFVGGGEFGGPDEDFVALVDASAVAAALQGGGPVNPSNPQHVRRLDPNEKSESDFYAIRFNPANKRLLIQSTGQDLLYVYGRNTVPALSSLGLVALACGVLASGILCARANRREPTD